MRRLFEKEGILRSLTLPQNDKISVFLSAILRIADIRALPLAISLFSNKG